MNQFSLSDIKVREQVFRKAYLRKLETDELLNGFFAF